MPVPVAIGMRENGQRRRSRQRGDDQELPEAQPVHPAEPTG